MNESVVAAIAKHQGYAPSDIDMAAFGAAVQAAMGKNTKPPDAGGYRVKTQAGAVTTAVRPEKRPTDTVAYKVGYIIGNMFVVMGALGIMAAIVIILSRFALGT